MILRHLQQPGKLARYVPEAAYSDPVGGNAGEVGHVEKKWRIGVISPLLFAAKRPLKIVKKRFGVESLNCRVSFISLNSCKYILC